MRIGVNHKGLQSTGKSRLVDQLKKELQIITLKEHFTIVLDFGSKLGKTEEKQNKSTIYGQNFFM